MVKKSTHKYKKVHCEVSFPILPPRGLTLRTGNLVSTCLPREIDLLLSKVFLPLFSHQNTCRISYYVLSFLHLKCIKDIFPGQHSFSIENRSFLEPKVLSSRDGNPLPFLFSTALLSPAYLQAPAHPWPLGTSFSGKYLEGGLAWAPLEVWGLKRGPRRRCGPLSTPTQAHLGPRAPAARAPGCTLGCGHEIGAPDTADPWGAKA